MAKLLRWDYGRRRRLAVILHSYVYNLEVPSPLSRSFRLANVTSYPSFQVCDRVAYGGVFFEIKPSVRLTLSSLDSSRIESYMCRCARAVEGSLTASKQADRIDGAQRLARVGYEIVTIMSVARAKYRFAKVEARKPGLLVVGAGCIYNTLEQPACAVTYRVRARNARIRVMHGQHQNTPNFYTR
jgi:hypothetical protein